MTSNLKKISLILGIATFAGCAVGPDFKTPKTETTPYINAETQSPEIDTAWWQSFKDPVLEALIEQGVAANKDIDQSIARLREARSGRRTAQFELAPIAPINGAAQKIKRSTNNAFNFPGIGEEIENYDVGFDATWELDIYGRVRRSVEAARAIERGRVEELKDILHSVISEIARNYFELRGIQSRLMVAHHNAENQAETVRITSALLSAGQATELDTARANTQYKTTKATIPALEGEEMATMYRIATLCGQQPAKLVGTLSAAAPIPSYDGPIKIDSPENLLKRRPDIRVAEQNLAAATARIGIATADLFPRVTFIGSLGLSSTDFSSLGNSGTEDYAFGPQIYWAGLDLGRVYQTIRSSEASAEGALAAYEKAVLSALEDVESSLARYKKERERYVLLKEAAEDSGKAAKLARAQYQAGLVDFLSVLDAEDAALAAEDSQTQSQTKLITGLISIYKALGGGWQAYELKSLEESRS